MSGSEWESTDAEAWLHRWWHGGGGAAGSALSILMLPAEALFRATVLLRNRAYDIGLLASTPGPLPVISVGNLVVGGTGKTPVTAWLAERLERHGHRPAIVTRGYGRDEIELHRRWNPAVPVIVAPKRLDGVKEAAETGRSVVVVDDGFQHRALRRTRDVVLVAAEDPLPPKLLPRGPYREPFSALRRADLIIVTRRVATPAHADDVVARIRAAGVESAMMRIRLIPTGWTDLRGAEAPPPRGRILAVSAIARPDVFHQLLRDHGYLDLASLSFPDHHEYSRTDAETIETAAQGRTLVTTEKDAVKLQAFGNRLGKGRVLRLGIELEEGAEALQRLLSAAGAAGTVRTETKPLEQTDREVNGA